ncbi:outer membrane beta-barrel family protein [Larkinella soli]|uniref:outer membrane beta-barrel family protein n=1 Tax=Larkinella soli TaxID=1770527 RepID=UPI000FFCB7BB|nr:outer membrane beta-barrel family protein [Larkinella soli]
MGLLGSVAVVQGQTAPAATLVGRVLDPAGRPAPFATVRLRSTTDSTLQTGTVGDSAGTYRFQAVDPGRYALTASLVGQGTSRPAVISVAPGVVRLTIPDLHLTDTGNTLAEVNVRAVKPFVEQFPDRTVLNVESSPLAAGGTALEVLERAPGVVVDLQNERILLQGRDGVLLLMDDKPTYLSTTDLVNLLRSTPAGSIETIEITTKPSARFDAAGNAGLINIRMKQSRPRSEPGRKGATAEPGKPAGTNGSLSLTGGYGRFAKAGAGLLVSHQSARGLSLYGNYTYDYRRQWSSLEGRRVLPESAGRLGLKTLFYRPGTIRNHTYKAGADLPLSRRTALGGSVSGSVTGNRARIDNDNLLYQPDGRFLRTVNFTNASARDLSRFVGNVNVRHRFDSTGRSLSADLDYAAVRVDTRDNMITRLAESAEPTPFPTRYQRNRSPSDITIRSAKADYTHPLGKATRLEAGWKSSLVRTDNDLRFENLTDGVWQPDSGRTNHFVYDETVHAAYLTGSHEGAKWSLQAGLRAEYTHSKGHSVTLGQVVERRYLNLFPNVLLTWKAGRDHQFRYAFSRRIDRPNYQNLNPFVYVSDSYSYFEGDPYLQPQYTQAFEVGYIYKNETSLSFGYSRTRDVIAHINEQRGEQLRYGPANLRRMDSYNLTAGFPLKPTAWWSFRTSVSAFVNVYEAVVQNEPLNDWGPAANLNMSHSFRLPGGITAELSGVYNSPRIDGMTRYLSDGQVSVGAQKQFLKKRATLRLNATDLFFTSRVGGAIHHGLTDLDWVSRRESRTVRLAFSYQLGNQKLKISSQTRSGSEDEQRRTN